MPLISAIWLATLWFRIIGLGVDIRALRGAEATIASSDLLWRAQSNP